MLKFIFIFFLCVNCVITSFAQKNFLDQPYIEVNGFADTLITPNEIYIKIIISEKDTRDKISLEEQENNMINSFKKLGIVTETNLTVSDMLSNYKFYVLKQKDILKTKEYLLKVADASTTNNVFIELEKIGISNTSIERVDHSDIEKIKNLCRTAAILNAHSKAIALTKPIAQTIGNAILISDNETNYDNQIMGKAVAFQIRGLNSFNESKYEDPKIEFKKINVSASVSVKYVLK